MGACDFLRCEGMKIRIRQITSQYFNRWWIPATVCLVLLAAFTVAALPHLRPLAIFSNVLFVCLAIAFLGILCAAVWNFIKKRWAKGVANLVMFPLCGVAAFVPMGFLMFALMFGTSDDGFAENLVIPDKIEGWQR